LPIESPSRVAAHTPVMADEVVRILAPRSGDTVVDCTFGAGGHARRLAPALGPHGRYIAIDRDPEAERWFRELSQDVVCETRFLRGNFADVLPQLAEEGVAADGILIDLGVSSMQIDRPERGFSYSREAPLDMRMDPTSPTSAADVVAQADARDLERWFKTFGEERHSRRIANAIVARREESPITSTSDLVEIVRSAIPGPAQFGGGHPAKRVFQALRIVVNDEMDSLARGLVAGRDLLAPSGRMVVISFHSLEDRAVKRDFKSASTPDAPPPEVPVRADEIPAAPFHLATPKALRPQQEEQDDNPRSRSARLRGLERSR
jgi:16S rRNA (cytosine1402-N4)-methyltransferase